MSMYSSSLEPTRICLGLALRTVTLPRYTLPRYAPLNPRHVALFRQRSPPESERLAVRRLHSMIDFRGRK